MNNELRVYTLKNLTPEERAVVFAKCSRSSKSFDEIAKELREGEASEFHKKWVIGFGHESIAEHAVLNLAIENVSILATKVIEDARLASFTEKSTRYQVFNRERYYKPRKIMESEFRDVYEETCDFIMDTYNKLIPKMIEFMKNKYPKKQQENERFYEVKIKNKALDVLRYMLPVSILTNLGMTVNARELRNVIKKLKSHSLEEMKEIGKAIENASRKELPTLSTDIKEDSYLKEVSQKLESFAKERINVSEEREKVKLVEYDKDALNKVLTSLLYRFSNGSYEEIKEKVRVMTEEEKEKIIDMAFSNFKRFDKTLRELEHVYYTFDILIDYGAFRDIQRHRMCTQTNQELTPYYGYDIPEEIIEAGFKNEFVECMEKAKEAYEKIKHLGKEAQYVLPLAYRKRVLFTMNLREIFYFVKLRSSKAGHKSYREVAQKIYELVKEKHPLLAKYMFVTFD